MTSLFDLLTSYSGDILLTGSSRGTRLLHVSRIACYPSEQAALATAGLSLEVQHEFSFLNRERNLKQLIRYIRPFNQSFDCLYPKLFFS